MPIRRLRRDRRRRQHAAGGVMTVAAVLALAVVGTGGAFGYRTFMGSPRSGEPPVIKADPSPTKVVPRRPPANASKQIQDRLRRATAARAGLARGAAGGSEQIRRARRVSAADQNANPPPVAACRRPTGASAAAERPPPSNEPRKIKTLAVKGDAARRRRPAAAPAHSGTARDRAGRDRGPPPPVANANRAARPMPAPPRSLSPQRGSRRSRRRAAHGRPSGPPAVERRRLSGAGVVAAQRSRCAGLLPGAAGQIPRVLGSPSAADQARRSGRQGRLLPRHGRPVRLAGRGDRSSAAA